MGSTGGSARGFPGESEGLGAARSSARGVFRIFAPKWATRARLWTKGDAIDFVANCSSNAMLERSLHCERPSPRTSGRSQAPSLCCFGQVAGTRWGSASMPLASAARRPWSWHQVCGNDFRTRVRAMHHLGWGPDSCRPALREGRLPTLPAEVVAVANRADATLRRARRREGCCPTDGPLCVMWPHLDRPRLGACAGALQTAPRTSLASPDKNKSQAKSFPRSELSEFNHKDIGKGLAAS